MSLYQVLKRNPYHDKAGRFTFAHNANFVSLWATDLKRSPKRMETSFSDAAIPGTALRDEQDRLFGYGNQPGLLTADEKQLIRDFTVESHTLNVAAKKVAAGLISLDGPLSVQEPAAGSHPTAMISYYKQKESAYERKIVTQMDSAINKASWPTDQMMFRGLSSNSKLREAIADGIASGRVQPGAVIRVPSYMSTSTDESEAQNFVAATRGILFKIRTPKGAKVLWTGDYGWGGGAEKEGIFARNTKFFVRKVTSHNVGNWHSVEVDVIQ